MQLAVANTKKEMITKVKALRARGMTAFYSAVYQAVTKLQTELAAQPNTPKWLVALTDGADNKSTPGDAQRAADIIRRTPNLNVAIITIGDDIDKQVVQTFLDAAKSQKAAAMLVQAKDQSEIAKAFATVAKAMGGVSEVL